MATSAKVFERDLRPAARPIWLESLVGIDWMLLHVAPVYYGLGVQRGDGSAVILVPGFLTTDIYLRELSCWLRRIGYRPYLSNIGWNADCINLLVSRLAKTVERAHKKTNGKVHLIGHSLGGILSRSTAALNPDKVASIITLGSPFRGIRSHPMVLQMAEKIRQRIFAERDTSSHPNCYTVYCDCTAVNAMQNEIPSSILQSAIYTKTDGIVDWRSCINDDPETDYEVAGTHFGLAFNHQVYSLIAKRLVEATR